MTIDSGAIGGTSEAGRHGLGVAQSRERFEKRIAARPARFVGTGSTLRLTGAATTELRPRYGASRLKSPNAEVAIAASSVAVQSPLASIDFPSLGRGIYRRYFGWQPRLKRAMDVVLAALMLAISAPVLAALALAIRVESRGPIFFRQWRDGLNGEEFLIWKFRTMQFQPGSERGTPQTLRNDPRVTRVGRFLRSTSLDELPQLFNVLRGEMSLVGPRPHLVDMLEQPELCEDRVAEYTYRHSVRPGITGWAQVNGSRGPVSGVEDMRKRVALDLYYIENWSLSLDVRIIWSTFLLLILDRTNAY